MLIPKGKRIHLSRHLNNWPREGTKFLIVNIAKDDDYYQNREAIIGSIGTVSSRRDAYAKFSKAISNGGYSTIGPGEHVCFRSIEVIILEDPDNNWVFV